MEPLRRFFEQAGKDRRLGPGHISVYVALLSLLLEQSEADGLTIHREQVLERCRVGKTRYYQYMKELAAFGYIDYQPDRYPGRRSRVRFVNYSQTTDRTRMIPW